MGFRFSERALALARGSGGVLRIEIPPGPQYARPMPLDVYFEDAPPRDHVAVVCSGVTVCVPGHLGWLADNDVAIDAAVDGHLHGSIEAVRRPW